MVDVHEARQRGGLMAGLAAVPAIATLAAAVACACWAPLRAVFGVHPSVAAPVLVAVTALPFVTALVGMGTMRVAALFVHFALVVGVTVIAPTAQLLCFHAYSRRNWNAPSEYCIPDSSDSEYDCTSPLLVPSVVVFVLCFLDTVFGVCFFCSLLQTHSTKHNCCSLLACACDTDDLDSSIVSLLATSACLFPWSIHCCLVSHPITSVFKNNCVSLYPLVLSCC